MTATENQYVTKQGEFVEINGMQFPLETITVKSDDKEKKLKILCIDSVEMFPKAIDYKTTFTTKIGDKTATFQCRAISYGEWESIEMLFPDPEIDSSKVGQAGYTNEIEIKRKEMKLMRKVLMIEKCLGMKIPSDSMNEKAEWISKRFPESQTGDLFEFLLSTGSNFPEETSEDIASLESSKIEEIINISDISQWEDICNTDIIFRMQRPEQDYIIEISVNQIPEQSKRQIEQQCIAPIPPSRPGRDPNSGKPSEAHPIYNYSDENYLKAISMNRVKRQVLNFESAIFKIPGDTLEEKQKWVSERILGDILLIQHFLQNKIYGTTGAVSFF